MFFCPQLSALWQARYFVYNSVRHDFISRVIRSRLGLFWVVLYPLAQVAIYAFILSVVLSAKLPGLDKPYAYPLFLCAGMLAWSLFSDLISRGLNLFIDQGSLLKKLAFPRLALPIALSITALLNNFLLLIATLAVFWLLGDLPGITLIWLPILIFLVLILGIGLALVLGLVNVFIRDIGQFTLLGLQFGFWLTPIAYSLDLVPESYQVFLLLNPLSGLVQGYQQVLVYHQAPNYWMLIYSGVWGVLSLWAALFVYRHAIDEVVDAL